MGVYNPKSKGHAKAWQPVTPAQGATEKRGSPQPQLKRPNKDLGIRHRTQRATPKHGSTSPPPKRTHKSVGVCHPNSRSQAKAWESFTTTKGATQKCGSPLPDLEKTTPKRESSSAQIRGPQQSVGVSHPNSRGHAKVGSTPKCGSPSPQLRGPHKSVGVCQPNSRGHAKAWGSVITKQRAAQNRGIPSPQLKGPAAPICVIVHNGDMTPVHLELTSHNSRQL